MASMYRSQNDYSMKKAEFGWCLFYFCAGILIVTVPFHMFLTWRGHNYDGEVGVYFLCSSFWTVVFFIGLFAILTS